MNEFMKNDKTKEKMINKERYLSLLDTKKF